MDNTEALTVPEVDGVVVKEDKKTAAKIWGKAVDTGVAIEKTKIKATPAMLKIVCLAAPELAPILLPLSKFMKSKSGQKWIEKSQKNYDAMGEALKGNTQPMKDNIEDNINFLNSEEGTEYAKDAIELAKGMSK